MISQKAGQYYYYYYILLLKMWRLQLSKSWLSHELIYGFVSASPDSQLLLLAMFLQRLAMDAILALVVFQGWNYRIGNDRNWIKFSDHSPIWCLQESICNCFRFTAHSSDIFCCHIFLATLAVYFVLQLNHSLVWCNFKIICIWISIFLDDSHAFGLQLICFSSLVNKLP